MTGTPATTRFLTLEEIEPVICDCASAASGVWREKVFPHSRVIRDLRCDSICFLDLAIRIEDALGVALLDHEAEPVLKALFTRPDYRISDLAEAVYLAQTLPRPQRRARFGRGDRPRPRSRPPREAAFLQLGGILREGDLPSDSLYEPVEARTPAHTPLLRRRTDGMLCVRLPAADVALGTDGSDAAPDERPAHRARLSEFAIDIEPISTTAYARFLNSIGPVHDDVLARWFVLDPTDPRRPHEVIERSPDGRWRPRDGADRWPMVLVSWDGAAAYSLWAHARDWREWEAGATRLPSEAQWEYAARGPEPREYPWGDEPATSELASTGGHEAGTTYVPGALPMPAVNDRLGVSPFGLRHMAGTVWQWCRDWYSPTFYAAGESAAADPVNTTCTGVRSERGGSWVGPAALARSSYRRGREPWARGRCLGFRCAAPPTN